MEIAKSSPNGLKTLGEKEKLLITSNFSFSHNVFKRLVLQTGKNQGLFGKELNKNQQTLQRGFNIKRPCIIIFQEGIQVEARASTFFFQGGSSGFNLFFSKYGLCEKKIKKEKQR